MTENILEDVVLVWEITCGIDEVEKEVMQIINFYGSFIHYGNRPKIKIKLCEKKLINVDMDVINVEELKNSIKKAL